MHYFKTETADWLYRFLGTVWMEEKFGDKIDPESSKLLRESKKAALESLKSLYDNAKHNKELQDDSMFSILKGIFENKPTKEEQPSNKVKNVTQPRINIRGLYGLFWNRLIELDDRSGDVIPLQSVYTKLCRSFSIKKRECQEILFMLRDFGLIKFEKRGISICRNIAQIS